MINKKNMIACGGSLLMGLAGIAQADTSTDALRAEVAELRAEMAALQGANDQAWLNERRSEEVRALVNDVLADADTRASLLEGGATAGHNGKNFFLASEDGSFLMKIKGQTQVRYIANFSDLNDADQALDDGFDAEEQGFEMRRAKIGFSGHIGSPKILYGTRLAVNRKDNNAYADEIWVGYQWSDTIQILAGEAKVKFLREEGVSSSRQLAVERSLVNEVFTAGYAQGVLVNWDACDMVKMGFAFSDGARSGEGDAKRWDSDDVEYAVTARADVRLAGDWKQAKDFSAWDGEELAIFVGGAAHYQEFDTHVGSGNTQRSFDDLFVWTLDASVETNGLNVFGAVMGSHASGSGSAADSDDYGFVVQGGYMVIPDKLEPFVRYEYMDGDSIQQTSLVTIGANYYLNKHNAKFTVDAVWALDSIDSSALMPFGGSTSISGLGLKDDSSGEEDQLAVRAQFQLLF